ncbi:lipoprotein insertase outer membrane protein LolB [Neptunicella marina]|uniref:Outer-membrane lipoprotein LolB n=1 Tax=Neptunicella marina TaxID=2125989 RepID=A0A8J6IJG5_9ALTE|nr:lipoprotein insertase outer membrane protein LolB [Neptunicella marina]MBC3764365.1 outer membrane lipoprotein LolB [Neptunicella marina]
MRILFLLVCIALSACVSKPPLSQQSVNTLAHQKLLHQIQHWQIEGRIAYLEGKEKHSANLTWQQKKNDLELDLRSFIGTSVLHLEQNSNGATLEMDGEQYQDSRAEFLLYNLTGWHIPVSALSAWIKGEIKGNETADFAKQGWLSSLNYAGWNATFSGYRNVNNVPLPHNIILSKQQKRVVIRINQWKIKQ